MPLSPRSADRLARRLLGAEDLAALDALSLPETPNGFDPFGLNREWLGLGMLLLTPVYDRWFHVRSRGHENVPLEGPAVLACNHSGSLPVDAMMVWVDLVRHVGRVPRVVADHFVPTLPWLSTLFARTGSIGGSRGNVRALLSEGALIVIFPEGTEGVGKPRELAYQLQPFRVGHAELAIRHGAPVVPIACVGFEEAWPLAGRLDGLGQRLGLPYLPIPATPLPRPVPTRVLYGEPIPLHERHAPEEADDPEVVRAAAAEVQAAVAALIAEGRAELQS
ncbi:MAG: acyltransferase family protein [Alphaproteobacteria bacterium]|nr:acyltransferase family protein [Alphaproteobacteria bacterium]